LLIIILDLHHLNNKSSAKNEKASYIVLNNTDLNRDEFKQ